MDGSLFGSASQPLVVAHRGASRRAPENTLAAFEAAIELGCDAVELDVRRTGDGALVVHHAAARRGVPLAQLTHAELAQRSRHPPPAFAEVVELCADRIGLDVEVKEAGIEAEVLAVLSQRFPRNRLLITSFHEEVVVAIKRRDAAVLCGLLVSPTALSGTRRQRGARDTLARALRCGADLLLPHQLLVPLTEPARLSQRERDLAGLAAGAGLGVIPWTVNSARRMERYIGDARLRGIITDLPDVALGLRRRLSLPPFQGTS